MKPSKRKDRTPTRKSNLPDSVAKRLFSGFRVDSSEWLDESTKSVATRHGTGVVLDPVTSDEDPKGDLRRDVG